MCLVPNIRHISYCSPYFTTFVAYLSAKEKNTY